MTPGCGYRRIRFYLGRKAPRGGVMIARVAFGAALMLAAVDDSGTFAQSRAASDGLFGRWDLVVQRDTQTSPSWLEVERSGTATLVGQFVGSGGSARPIARIEFTDGTLRFAIPPQWESNPRDITFEGRLEGDRLTGSMTMGDGQKATWSGTRAPSLRRAEPSGWNEPITLFSGKDLGGWQPVGGGESQWSAAGGTLRNAKRGANLVTLGKFDDFKLHLEFRVPKGENSGVYLRGRYELQIDDSAGLEPSSHHTGGLYGFIAPSENVARAAGEWQSMEVTLVGRMLTYALNGTTVICNREIPGITGGALDSAEADPGPLMLQGDHGPVDFRNIVITPAKEALSQRSAVVSATGGIRMQQLIPATLLALSFQAAIATSPAPNTLTAAEKAAGWQLLFDGRSLDGWRGYRRDTPPDAGWEVKDGTLRTVAKVKGVDII